MLSQHTITVRGFRINITARSERAAQMVAADWDKRHTDSTLAQYALDSNPDATMSAPPVCSAAWGPVSWAKAYGLWSEPTC